MTRLDCRGSGDLLVQPPSLLHSRITAPIFGIWTRRYMYFDVQLQARKRRLCAASILLFWHGRSVTARPSTLAEVESEAPDAPHGLRLFILSGASAALVADCQARRRLSYSLRPRLPGWPYALDLQQHSRRTRAQASHCS